MLNETTARVNVYLLYPSLRESSTVEQAYVTQTQHLIATANARVPLPTLRTVEKLLNRNRVSAVHGAVDFCRRADTDLQSRHSSTDDVARTTE